MIGILWISYLITELAEALQFFHTPSHIQLRASTSNNASNFGFAMAYQPSQPPNLIVGAPRESAQGEVFLCPFGDADIMKMMNTSEFDCDRVPINVHELMGTTERLTRNLFLGASISATSKFFLTCAPHWADTNVQAPIGTCVIYDGAAHRVIGPYEQLREKNKTLLGGYGWSLLADNQNNITLISKSSPVITNIMTLNNSDPLNQRGTKSMIWTEERTLNSNSKYFKINRNTGYALSAGHYFPGKYNYVLSETREEMKGQIRFLGYSNSNLVFESVLSDNSVGSMYGAALFSADINRDGLTDLLIGAPTHAVDNGFENGAVHIFLGGAQDKLSDKNRTRSIYSSIDGARFGSAIVSVDLDHDGFPELIISAPYSEDFGVVYIISGSEVNKLICSQQSERSVDLSSFNSIQEIFNTEYKSFGFSLQVIPDLDGNGCDELAVGSPESALVLLYPCIPRVNVTISAKLKGVKNFVSDEENSFTLEVCLNASDNFNQRLKVLEFIVTNTIIPNAVIEKNNVSFIMRIIFKSKKIVCEDVFINLYDTEIGFFNFTTQAKMNELDLNHDNNVYETDNETRRVVLGLDSITKARLGIERRCEGDRCLPRFNMSLLWSASSPYILGSSREEFLTVKINNEGRSPYDACAKIKIDGVQISSIGCPKEDGLYTCYLPRTMKRLTQNSINITLNMTSLTNFDKLFTANISLYDSCKENNSTKKSLSIPFTLDTNQILLKGTTQNRNLTSKELESDETISIANVVRVTNNGSITWKNQLISIESLKSSFVSITSVDCGLHPTDILVLTNYSCELNELIGNSSTTIYLYMELNKIKLRSLFEDQDLVLNTDFLFSISLKPTKVVKEIRLLSNISLTKEQLKFGQNKVLVICLSIIVAIIGLSIIVIILIKMKFFKRKQKEKLDDLKDNIRRLSTIHDDFEHTIELQDFRKRKLSNLQRVSEENLVDSE